MTGAARPWHTTHTPGEGMDRGKPPIYSDACSAEGRDDENEDPHPAS